MHMSGSIERGTGLPVPTRYPVLFLTRGTAVPGVLALRANLEVFPLPHDLATVVKAKLIPLQRPLAQIVERVDWSTPPLVPER
jgi:hypothetical protein